MSKKDSEKKLSSVRIDSTAFKIFNYLILILIVVIILVPIFIVFNSSFKSNEDYMYSGIFELPKKLFDFQNYKNVWDKGDMPLAFRNTGFLVLFSVTVSVLMGTMVAYILGRFKFRFKNLILMFFLVPTLIPSITTQIATFTIVKGLGLYNTIGAGMLLYSVTDITSIYIFLQFVEKIPYSLDESALLEGASYFRIYRSIIIPQMKPAIATVIILKTVSIYNDMFIPYLYMPDINLKTVSTALMKFAYDQNSQWNVMGAGIIAVMIPTIILYVFLQKYIFAGLTDGAVKD